MADFAAGFTTGVAGLTIGLGVAAGVVRVGVTAWGAGVVDFGRVAEGATLVVVAREVTVFGGTAGTAGAAGGVLALDAELLPLRNSTA